MNVSQDRRPVIVALVYIVISCLFLLQSASLIRFYHSTIPDQADLDVHLTIPVHRQFQSPDGSFHGIPMYYTDKVLQSEVRCIGENFESTSWYYQSCQFRDMCYDLNTKEFVLYTDQIPRERSDVYISTVPYNKTVAGGGQPAAWFLKVSRGKFFPTIRTTPIRGYYQLTSNIVWLPYFPQSACNPGHLVWDTFLPLFILMEIFDIADLQPLLFQMSHDANSYRRQQIDSAMCPDILEKFLPLMGIFNLSSVSNNTFLNVAFVGKSQSNLVCAPTSAVGVGMLTDHGLSQHGQMKEDYLKPHNVGRALLLRRFRAFALRNANIPDIGLHSTANYKTLTITFNTFSSGAIERTTQFGKQMEAVQNAFHNKSFGINVKQVVLRELTLSEQISLCTQSAVFVTTGGGGTVTATFLPKGATLIIFYHERDTDGFPVKMDWDLWNHYADINVHWLPIKTMNNREDLHILVEIMKHDLQVLQEDWDNAARGLG